MYINTCENSQKNETPEEWNSQSGGIPRGVELPGEWNSQGSGTPRGWNSQGGGTLRAKFNLLSGVSLFWEFDLLGILL